MNSIFDLKIDFRQYSNWIITENLHIKHWQSKFTGLEDVGTVCFLKPVVISECLICCDAITQKHEIVMCEHCQIFSHFQCKAMWHKTAKKFTCENCRASNKIIGSEIALIGKTTFHHNGKVFTWEEYVNNVKSTDNLQQHMAPH